MLYYLFDYINDFPGAGLFRFISFRAALAIIFSLVFSLVWGEKLIAYMQKLQVKETIRELGLAGEEQKKGTPTMGGLIIIGAILIPTLLLAKLENIYIILLLVTTVWMGLIGFVDDYIKVFLKDKKGLRGRTKIIGQIGLGIVVGSVMYFHPDVVVRSDNLPAYQHEVVNTISSTNKAGESIELYDFKAPVTNVPFLKSYQFDYRNVISFLGGSSNVLGFVVYLLVIVFIVTSVSNAANLTDGIDGLATGVSAIAGGCLGLLAYFSGNIIFADYLNIMYLPNTGELVVFAAAFLGACTGFLWYNAFPAQVFMGDTGSLMLGGVIATLAIVIRKELLIPVLCGIFLLENLSVVIQVGYFKYSRRKYGVGRRVFLMSPLHHHYQKKGIHEAKIVTRFWIVGILLAVLTIVTLKIR